MKPQYKPYLLRLLVTFLVSVAAMVIITEGAYLLQKEDTDRGPKTIQIVIPAGASERVAAGETLDTLPENMTFVIGDVLEVVNQDAVNHQLGPIWVPPGSTGRIVLDQSDKFSYTCSFAPNNYLGLDVKKPTTLKTRLTGLAISVPTTMAFLFIYSLLVFPIGGKAKTSRTEAGI